MKNTAVRIVEEHSAMTLEQINCELRARLPQKPRICRSTLSPRLHSQLIVLKLEEDPAQRNREDTKQLRKDFAEWLMNDGVRRQELIFIDETGFNL